MKNVLCWDGTTVVNFHVIIVGKYVIQRKKDLRIECFNARMYEDFKTERMTASMDNRYNKFVRKWGPLIQFFEQR